MVMDVVTIGSGRLTAGISPLGAELPYLNDSDGHTLQWDGDPAFWRGRAPILFPVIGLLEGGCYLLDGVFYAMPKHGFARHSIFHLLDRTPDTATLRLTASEATREIYPFDFRLDIDFALADATLSVAATIANDGDTPMPASLGFHPALRWPLPFGQARAAHTIQFAQDEPAPVRRIDANGLLLPEPRPTPVVGDTLALRDDLFVDDALIFDRLESRCVRYGASSGPYLEVAFADFPTLGVWTKPGAGFICIEPWQGFSDPIGFAGDIRDKPGNFQIAPGASNQLTMHITLAG